MTARHGFSSLLRPLGRLPTSGSYSRSLSVSTRQLKEHGPDENDTLSKQIDCDDRGPRNATRDNLPARVRHLMRSTPNALTVIISSLSAGKHQGNPSAALEETKHVRPGLAAEQNDHHPPPKLAGLLVSSFNTVTLTPRPCVSFNIKLPSTTYSAIKASDGFTASGLKDARVADAFVKRKPDPPGAPHGGNGWRELVGSDGRLRAGRGGTWWMRCRLWGEKCVEVGDHMIVVARVVECGGYEGGGGVGLVYAQGGYRMVGEAVDIFDETR